MNIAKSLKKLASNQTFVVLAAVVAVAAVYYYTQSFNTPVGAMTGQNEAAEAADSNSQVQSCPGGNNFMPSKPLGQNGGHGAASGAVTDTY